MSKTKPKILIVEDDIGSEQFYRFILEEQYDLCVVPTVSRAKETLSKQAFKLAIIDISLPGEEDGLNLIKYMRQTYPEISCIITITANAFPHFREASIKAGSSEFFTKPILRQTLIDILDEYVQASK
ncbi:MAG: response regulator [Candidatus Marinimicrobia bacterium]|nr:response regulator [Candidatus Neomarinimicrobiota bacterium]